MQYKPYPLLTCKPKNSSITEIPFDSNQDKISFNKMSVNFPIKIEKSPNRDNLINEACKLVNKGALVLWIENTVKEVQQTYKLFEAVLPDKVGILHSRFTARDRAKNEKYWIEKLGKNDKNVRYELNASGIKQGCILIATQVCEQSLDIDADILYTSLCPIDMFLQRAGRLWRHRCNDIHRPVDLHPTIIWFAEDLRNMGNSISNKKELFKFKKNWGSSSYVYEPFLLCRTMDILEKRKHINIPGDIREIIEETYSNTTDYPYLQKLVKYNKAFSEQLATEATNIHRFFNDAPNLKCDLEDDEKNLLDDPEIDGTRLNSNSMKVCLLNDSGTATIYGDSISYIDKKDKSTIKINIYNASLSLPSNIVDSLKIHIKKEVPGDKYTTTLRLRKTGLCWFPFDSNTGSIIKNHSYDSKRGWIHE